jgi:hypothetical protein
MTCIEDIEMLRLVRVAAAAARTREFVASAALLFVAACTSGDGGLATGGGQDPDPATIDFKVAYVKRPLPEDAMPQTDVRRLEGFEPGGDLYVRDNASPSAAERNVTGEITQGEGDVRDVEPSFDGTKVVFALHEPLIEGADPEDQPTWDVWEYDTTTRELRRVFTSDLVADEGDDIMPHYLPDGRIVFSSTRQRQSKAILLDEGKPQFEAQDEDREEPAFLLHVMNADGSDIHQISFNQSHDLDPSVMDDGRIMFSRWDHAGGNNELNLYAVRPDGTQLELLYGAQSHATGTNGSDIQFLEPRPSDNGKIVARAQPFTATDLGGDLVEIEVANYVENTQPTLPNRGVLSGPAQQPATINVVSTIEGPSPGGRYGSVFALRDGTGRLLVSWTQCRLLEDTQIVPCTDENLASPTAEPAPVLYGLFMYDPARETQLPVVEPTEAVIFTDAVALQPVTLPPVLIDRIAGVDYDAELESEAVGILDIRSVYDIDGVDSSPGGLVLLADPGATTAAQRPARFLRVEKAVSLPDEDLRDFDTSAFGVTSEFGMREILGYANVEPDGSVRVKVPANVPLAVTVLDADGRRIGPRHDNWLQAKPGQELKCNGCHDPASGESHGRSDLFAAANAGATTTGQPFPNTNPAFFADFGETMAQTRARISCQTDCAALNLSVDIVFDDVWTDPAAAGRAPDPSFAYRYSDLATPAPTATDCLTQWRSGCRVTIHYERHIHPLWSRPRLTLANDGVTVLADHTCTTCHTNRDAAGALKVPAGQLELTDGASSEEATQFQAYRELLAQDNQQQLGGGALQDTTVTIEPSMVAGNATESVTFFSRFGPGGSHEGWLEPAELKLVSEWLDIGAQYFNDPFAAPVN